MSSCSTAFIVNYQTLADVSTSLTKAIDKLKLAGQNLDQVFNFRHGRAFAPRTSFIAAKLPNLKWKTWPKQLLGYLLWAFLLPTGTLNKMHMLWQNILLWERMLQHQRNRRIWNPPNLIDSLFILLIHITKNTQVYNFSNSHFWPMPPPFLSNIPRLTPLIHCSLSLSPTSSINSPLCFTCCIFT